MMLDTILCVAQQCSTVVNGSDCAAHLFSTRSYYLLLLFRSSSILVVFYSASAWTQKAQPNEIDLSDILICPRLRCQKCGEKGAYVLA